MVIQGQGQTTGQLQLIPQGVTVIPGPGQQLMQAAMPNGTIQRFLFTPLPAAATTTSTTTTTVSTSTSGKHCSAQQKRNLGSNCRGIFMQLEVVSHCSKFVGSVLQSLLSSCIEFCSSCRGCGFSRLLAVPFAINGLSFVVHSRRGSEAGSAGTASPGRARGAGTAPGPARLGHGTARGGPAPGRAARGPEPARGSW